jgi:hypothetical protein
MHKLSLALLGIVIAIASAGCTVEVNEPDGTIDVEWFLFVDGFQEDCFDAAVEDISVIVTPVGGGISDEFIFFCEDDFGFIDVPEDTYDVSVAGLFDGQVVTSEVIFLDVDVFSGLTTPTLIADLDVF